MIGWPLWVLLPEIFANTSATVRPPERCMRYLAVLVVLASGVASGAGAGSNAGPDALLRCRHFTPAAISKPTPQADREAIERFELINHEAKIRSHMFVFLGDSLTQKWDRRLWERYFAPRGALNAGVNGDRTEHVLWRIEHGNIDRQQPTIAVLLIGTNDIGRNRSADIIAEGVRDILTVLRSRLSTTRILLLGVLPRSEWPSSDRRRQVTEVNRLIGTCADREHVFYADVGNVLLDSAGRLIPEVSPDGVHLSEHGYDLLTARLEVEFAKLLPKQ